METKSLSLAEALPAEIERCDELLAEYKAIPAGRFAAIMLEQELREATTAMAEGDTVGMIRCYQKLKESN